MESSFNFSNKWTAVFAGTDKDDTNEKICILVTSNANNRVSVVIQKHPQPTSGRFGDCLLSPVASAAPVAAATPVAVASVADPSANVEEATAGNCVDLTGNDTSAVADTSEEEEEEQEDTFDEESAMLGHQVGDLEFDSGSSDESSDGCAGMMGHSQEAFGFTPRHSAHHRCCPLS